MQHSLNIQPFENRKIEENIQPLLNMYPFQTIGLGKIIYPIEPNIWLLSNITHHQKGQSFLCKPLPNKVLCIWGIAYPSHLKHSWKLKSIFKAIFHILCGSSTFAINTLNLLNVFCQKSTGYWSIKHKIFIIYPYLFYCL